MSSHSQARNPVAARLYKVLNSKFNDEETSQALQTLSELYATPSPGKEQESDRNLGEDVEEQMNSGPASSTSRVTLVENFPGESAARARKDMRKDMERKLAEESRQFLNALGEIDFVSIDFLPMYRMSIKISY